jgi:hypothetical protein
MAEDVEIAARVVSLGRLGLGRREIASRLGLGPADLEAIAARSPQVAQALLRAAEEAWAWWTALPRQALGAGARFNVQAWREAMWATFGEENPAPPPRAEPTIRITIPDNGRQRPYPLWDEDDDEDSDDDADRDDGEDDGCVPGMED